MTDQALRRRVLITGATGFIGSRLLARVLGAGWDVRALVRTRPDDADPAVDWRVADITDRALDWYELVDGVDTAFHLAWTTVPFSADADPAANIEQNLPPGLRLAAAMANRPGARLIFFSSGGTIYGLPATTRIPEEHPQVPTSFYGESKLQMERQLALFHTLKGLDRTVLRVSNPFGGGQRKNGNFGAVATFARRALAGEEIVIWGDGSVVRDYIYIDDLIDAVVKVAEAERPAATYNIGSGEGRALNEIIEGLRDLVSEPVRVRYEPARAYDVPVNVLDISRARAELGWMPRVPFGEGLAATMAALRAEGV